MEFLSLESDEQLEQLAGENKPQIIFKHNTTCPISKRVLRTLKEQRDFLPEVPFYILDLLSFSELSSKISEKFGIKHESPQLLVVKGGDCEYHESLYNITPEETASALSKYNN